MTMIASRHAVLPLLLALLGCATVSRGTASSLVAGDVCNQPDSTYLDRYKPEGAQFSYQDYAEQTYLYAQLADNAYPEPFPWVLPDSIRLMRSVEDTATGFAARVYEFGRVGAPSKVMIAYRGTEGPFFVSKDWGQGNWTTNQHPHAEALFDSVRARYPKSVLVHSTGHSLGGALALQVSITNDHASAFVFNTSYRVDRRGPETESLRISIGERGEILTPVRWLLPNMTLRHLPGFNCRRGGPIDNHGMTSLARCLTRIAAGADPGALESLRRNVASCSQASLPSIDDGIRRAD